MDDRTPLRWQDATRVPPRPCVHCQQLLNAIKQFGPFTGWPMLQLCLYCHGWTALDEDGTIRKPTTMELMEVVHEPGYQALMRFAGLLP